MIRSSQGATEGLVFEQYVALIAIKEQSPV
jgi:hypothetical protein